MSIAVLACLAWGDPVAAQDRASDPDRVYETSVQDRLAGRHAASIEGSRRVLATRPTDVDARLNLALALIAVDRLAEAELELDIVLAQAPNYADARMAQAQIDQLRVDRVTWRFDVSSAYSDLSRGLDPWRETFATLGRRTARGTISGTIEYAERFERDDIFVEGRLDRTLGRGFVYGAIGGTPDADFRPQFALRGGGQIAVGGPGLAATIDAGIARYAVGTVTMLQPGAEYTTQGGALVIGGRWINVWDERDVYRTGYSFRAVLAIRPSLRLRAGFADAPESSDGSTVDVRATSLGAEADITDRVTVRLNGLKEKRTAYDRDEITLGVGVRF